MLTNAQIVQDTQTSSLLSSKDILLLLLRIRTHLLAKSKVRDLEAGEGPDTDKQDQEEGDDGGKAHEDAGCEVLVLLEEAALGRVGGLGVGGEVTLQLHLDGVWEGRVHLVCVLLDGLLGLRLGLGSGDVNDGVVGGLGVVDNEFLQCCIWTGQYWRYISAV